MNKTLKEIIALADELNPNAFSNDIKASWVSEAEHTVLSEIHCLAPGEIQDLFPYEAHKNDRLTLAPGDDKIYVLYLQAMIDFSNKEYAAYNNDMALFNLVYEFFHQVLQDMKILAKIQACRSSSLWKNESL